MSVINEEHKRYIERFVNPAFTEHDFVAVLLTIIMSKWY